MSLEGFDDLELEPDYRPRFPPGQPPKVIDLAAVERVASIGCTKEEIAAVLGIGRRTLYDHMASEPEIQEAIERGSDRGKATLRRLQWKGAQEGNATMLIWLGKQYLGQKDKSEFTGFDDGPIRVQVVLVGEAQPQQHIETSACSEARGEPVRKMIDFVGLVAGSDAGD